MNKKIFIPVIALTVVGASLFALKPALAADTTQSHPFAQRFATRFNLNPSDVEAFFTQEREAARAQHQQDYTTRLEKAVTEGKLTVQQKDALLAKWAELQKTRETNMAERDSRHAELLKWAADNKIDSSFLFGQMHRGGQHMQGMKNGMRSL